MSGDHWGGGNIFLMQVKKKTRFGIQKKCASLKRKQGRV